METQSEKELIKLKVFYVFYADGSTDPRYLEDMLRVIKYEKLSLIFVVGMKGVEV